MRRHPVKQATCCMMACVYETARRNGPVDCSRWWHIPEISEGPEAQQAQLMQPCGRPLPSNLTSLTSYGSRRLEDMGNAAQQRPSGVCMIIDFNIYMEQRSLLYRTRHVLIRKDLGPRSRTRIKPTSELSDARDNVPENNSICTMNFRDDLLLS